MCAGPQDLPTSSRALRGRESRREFPKGTDRRSVDMKSSRTTLENPPVGFRLEADSERVLAPRAGVCTVPHPFEDGTDVAQAAPVECAAATANEPRMNIEPLPA